MHAAACEDNVARAFVAALAPGGQARFRPGSGPHAARWLTAVPTEDALRFGDDLFRAAVARRLALPITAVSEHCEGCGAELDPYGHHRNTCTRTGRCHPRHRAIVLPRLTCSTAVDPLVVIMDPQAVTMDPLVVITEGRPAAIMDLQAAIMEDPLAVVDTMAGDRVGVDLTRRPAGDPRDPLAACTTGIDRRCPRCHQDTKPTHFCLFFVSLFI